MAAGVRAGRPGRVPGSRLLSIPNVAGVRRGVRTAPGAEGHGSVAPWPCPRCPAAADTVRSQGPHRPPAGRHGGPPWTPRRPGPSRGVGSGRAVVSTLEALVSTVHLSDIASLAVRPRCPQSVGTVWTPHTRRTPLARALGHYGHSAAQCGRHGRCGWTVWTPAQARFGRWPLRVSTASAAASGPLLASPVAWGLALSHQVIARRSPPAATERWT
jgi:hypothetical protein